MSASIQGNIPGEGYFRIVIDRSSGAISALEALGPQRIQAPFLAPGLIDIQLNGFAGIDFSDPDLEPEGVLGVLEPLWRTGTTSFCPTLITNTPERLSRNFSILEQARRADRRFARAVPCYHLEGPYLSHEARGVHAADLLRLPDWDEVAEWQEDAGGNIGILTLAPELPGALELVSRAWQLGVVIGLGHTMAAPEVIHAAVRAGAELSTHLGNGCPQTLDRHRNPLWAQLHLDQLSASIICDGFHLPADLVSVIYRLKTPGRCILITDATHVATLPPGRYSLVGTEIELLPDGKVIRADGGSLGGSSLSMNRAVSVFMRLAGAGLDEAIAAATRNPARLLRRPGVCARLAPGEPANILRFRPADEGLKIDAVYLAGEEVYTS